MHKHNLHIDAGRRPEEREDGLLTGPGLRLARIVSWGQASPPGFWYEQDEDEWLLLACGRARIDFADPGETLELLPGDYCLIPARRRHRVAWTDPQQASVWLALFLPAGSAQPP